MKFTSTHTFEWPAEKIIALIMAGEDLFPVESLQSVNARMPIDVKREGSKIIRRFEWRMHGQIPRAAQRMLSPEMLTFIEESVWSDESRTFESRIMPVYFKESISCNSTVYWTEHPAGAERRIESEATVDIPVVGGMVEKAVCDAFMRSNDASAELIRKGLAERLG